MQNLILWMLVSIALMLGLSGCSTAAKPIAIDTSGAGFVYVPFKRESTAYLINNDLEAWKKARGNNEVCQGKPGCKK